MKRTVIAVLLAGVFSLADAATVPAYTGSVNNSIGMVLNSKLGKTAALGPSYDAQFQRTMGAMNSGLNTFATTIVLGGGAVAVGAISWPALLVSAGIGGLVSGGVSLGVDGLIKWLWPDANHPNQVQLSGSGMGSQSPTYSNGISTGGIAWSINNGYWGSPQEAASALFSDSIRQYPDAAFTSVVFTTVNPTTITLTYNYNYPTSLKISGSGSKTIGSLTYNGITCTAGSGYVSGSTCSSAGLTVATNPMATASFSPVWQTVPQAVTSVPQNYATSQLSDEQIAAIVNTAWKAAGASQSAGTTFVYNAANPVTAADVVEARKANPNLAVSVNDFLAPIAPAGSTTVPLAVPNTTVPTTTTPTSPTQGTAQNPAKIDWGTFDPPALEPTPTTESILDPIFNMWPQWNGFSFPSHASQCPTPTFVAIHHTFTFDHMCMWVEMVRPGVQAAFALVWALMVIFIVMGA